MVYFDTFFIFTQNLPPPRAPATEPNPAYPSDSSLIGPQQMSQKNISYLLEGQDYKEGDMGKDGAGRYRKHHKKKQKTTLDGTRGEDGGTKTGCTGHGLKSGGKA